MNKLSRGTCTEDDEARKRDDKVGFKKEIIAGV